MFGGLDVMSIFRQRKLGFVLTAIAVVALTAYCSVVIIHSSPVGAPQGGSGPGVVAMSQEVRSDISTLYLIPIVLCGTTGLARLLWPSRKPPRLQR